MKKCLVVTLLLLFTSAIMRAESGDTLNIVPKEKVAQNRNIKVKMSALVAIGVVNPAVEFKVMDKFTVQLEALGVFYSSNFLGTGKPLVLGSSFFEFRYYPKEEFKGFFVAPNIGWGVYKLNKGLVLRYTDDYDWDCYQQGSNIMAGLTIGYTFNLNEKWSIELAWGGGFQHSRYSG